MKSKTCCQCSKEIDDEDLFCIADTDETLRKVIISNNINKLTGGDELLYCTRVYLNARVYGGLWVEMEWFLNNIFWLLRGQKQHCRASYIFEWRYHAKYKIQNDKVSIEKAEESTSCNNTSKTKDKP